MNKNCTNLQDYAILTHDWIIVRTRTDIFKNSNDCKKCSNKIKEECSKKLKQILENNKNNDRLIKIL